MPLSLDHLVILVRDLEQAIAHFDSLGFTVQQGGTHADGATHNALIGFADGSYFELIAFLKDAPQHRWWDTWQRHGEGWVDFALLPESVAATFGAARERGLHYAGPIDGGRVRPDGARLEWQIGTAPARDLPFLCADITPRDLRVAPGEVRTHRNGVNGVSGVTIAVRDLQASVARYQALLGATLSVHVAHLPGYGVALASFRVGELTSTLLALSNRAASGERNSPGTLAYDLQHQLENRGEGVFGVTLRTHDVAFARSQPLELTHAAQLELATGP
jgi:catechol 2,3-dioxygenase-like lactoylglutathione lyase family enzyme